MAWSRLEAARLDGRALDLYVDEAGVHMIRIDGLELMNGHGHESEEALGRLAARLAGSPSPHILLGGLGLGYTLAALARTLGGAGTITVAELSADVIRWYEAHFRPSLFQVPPANVRIVQTDVGSPIDGEAPYDVIALDVDNGPRALSADGNDGLYGVAGLGRFGARLAARGALLVWSAFESPDFAAAAQEAGFAVECLPMDAAGRRDFHFVYVLRRA